MSTEGNACILVVDDEPAVLTLITTLLKKNGYDHLGANSARDALALFTKHRDKVDLLVSDIMMPEMDGFALTSAIHRRKPDLPVIFVSAFCDTITDAHRYECISKPFAPAELLNTITKALAKKTTGADRG